MTLGSDSSPYIKDSNSSGLFPIERMFKCKIDIIWASLDVEGLSRTVGVYGGVQETCELLFGGKTPLKQVRTSERG